MSGAEDKKNELVKTPLGLDEAPTTDVTPEPSQPTAEVYLTDRARRDIAQRFDLLAELGRGGMGIVYRARDRETNEIIALKVVKPEIASRPDLIERFKSELRLARKITHKNVCRSYDLHRFGETVVIAMEYVEGQSLRAALNRPGGVSLRGGLNWASQVCAGLDEAHAQGIIHRDLKPENIVIDRSGQAKVMDFGIARSVEAAATQATGVITGTPAYMSPEQAQGKAVDARSDIYSFGLILYEVFTGKPAFHAETPAGLAYKRIHETPPPTRSVDPYVPPFLERAIGKCLEKDPKKRFQSAIELAVALEEQAVPKLEEGEPVPPPHLSVWTKRDWVLLILSVLGLVYFLEFRNTVFPAATKPLEVDAITARRAAEDFATKLGRPFPGAARAELEYRGEDYWITGLISRLDIKREGAPKGLEEGLSRAEVPVYWKVTFESPRELAFACTEDTPKCYAVINRQGKVREFSHPFPADWVFPNYKAPPAAERQAIAREAVTPACGTPPRDLALVEMSGGEQNASYSVVFKPAHPVNSPPWAKVSLFGEKVISFDCAPQANLSRSANIFPLYRGMQSFVRVVLLFALIWMLVSFGMGECYRSATLWRRAPLAGALGFAGVWLLASKFDEPAGVASSPPSLTLVLGGGLPVAGLILVGLVTAEQYMSRRTPSWIASYVLAWRGRWQEPAVVLAIVRGALAGLLLAGLETFLFHVSLGWWGSGRTIVRVVADGFTGFVDPTSVGLAASSFSPALFTISAAFFDGVIMILLGLGWQWAMSSYKQYRKEKQKFFQVSIILGLTVMPAMLTGALRLDLAQTLGPMMGFMAVPFVFFTALAWLFFVYDALSAIVAVGTAVLWTLNYPLLQIFRELGNSGQWAVFIGWGLLVAAAAAVAFRAELARSLQRAKAEMQ